VTTYRLSFEALEQRSLLSGFTPVQIRAAYGFTQAFHQYGNAAKGQGVTVAIVIAMNAPHAVRDLATYSHRYGLPPADISVTNLGGTTNGGAWYGFTTEAALDVETVHALLPLAKIHLIEAKSPDMFDLVTAEDYASSLSDVNIVSNSWGLPDTKLYGAYPEAFFDLSFNNTRVVYTAAAGDFAGPLWYPAADPRVIAVGGTVLTHNASGYHQKPWLSYTAGASNPARLGPNVSMIGASPGMSIFGPVGFTPSVWGHARGTSLSAPAFAAVVGVADGIRLSRGESPLTTKQVMVGLTPNEFPWVPSFITQFA
jgi:subtilase family serine protease